MNRAAATMRNYAELGRISNLPTCISNVLVGCALGAQGGSIPTVRAVAAGIAVALFYVGGMALNDAADVNVDRIERPGRVLPSGRISLRAAYTTAIAALSFAVLICVLLGKSAAAMALFLATTIVVYNLTHKRFAAAVVLMGMCRGLVYFLAASAIAWPLPTNAVYWLAGSMSAYVIVLSLLARGEAGPNATALRWLVVIEPAVVLPIAFVVNPPDPSYAIVAGLVLFTWLIIPARFILGRIPKAVPAILCLLAGISLVDAYFLTLLDRPMLALAAGACFVTTVVSHRHIIGT